MRACTSRSESGSIAFGKPEEEAVELYAMTTRTRGDVRLGPIHDVYFLTAPSDPQTVTLMQDLPHKGAPFQNQRYFHLGQFTQKNLKDTSDL